MKIGDKNFKIDPKSKKIFEFNPEKEEYEEVAPKNGKEINDGDIIEHAPEVTYTNKELLDFINSKAWDIHTK